jgi:hypothetical protein
MISNRTQSIDQFPYYDPLIKGKTDKMSEDWIAALSAFIETLNGYITPFGFVLPNLSQAQIDTIQSPANGQLIYNITADAPQFFQISSNSWRTISFT